MVDAAIANCFYGNEISFRVVEYVLFNRMVDALMKAPPVGYKTPTRQRLMTDLMTDLLESTRERIDSHRVGQVHVVRAHEDLGWFYCA